jgi:hypothetical protein
MHHNASIRRKKVHVLSQICRNASIVCLQEVHACQADLLLAGGPFARTHAWFPSFILNRQGQIVSDTGGVACLVDKSLFVRLSNVLVCVADLSFDQICAVCKNVVPGRAMEIEVFDGQGNVSLVCSNVHNYGLSNANMKAIEAAHSDACRVVQSSPLSKTYLRWRLGLLKNRP